MILAGGMRYSVMMDAFLNMWLACLTALLLAFIAAAQPASAQPPVGTREPTLFIHVFDASGRFETEPLPPIYLASNAKEWSPTTLRCIGHLAPTSQEPGGWMFAIPRGLIESARGPFEFKFTRGSWETVEVDAEGRDIANRFLPEFDWNRASDPEPMFTLTIEGFADQRGTRWATRATPTVVGELDVHAIPSRIMGADRTVRVWLPPGYDAPGNAQRRYGVLYMHDGQNCFDASTSFAGEWQVDETIVQLMADGVIDPWIVVGIDNGGATRSDDYTPMPIGPRRAGQGGKADNYIAFVVDELMPWVNERYRTRTGPAHTAMGGSSLGGVVTLHAAMSRPGIFGAILVESPSFWVGVATNGGEGGFHERAIAHAGDWPSRLFIAMGGAEYGRAEDDARLVEWVRGFEARLRSAGLGDDRLKVIIEPGAGHNEGAWSKRLPGALIFLLAPR